MSLIEKGNEVHYEPVHDEDASDSASELDGLMYRGLAATNRKERLQRALSRARPFVTKVLALAFYSVLIVTVTSLWWKREMLHGPGVAYNPLRKYVQWEAKKYPKMDVNHYMVMGPPDEERDAVWADLTQFFLTEFPREEQKKLGRLDEGVQLPNGNYVALYTVNHLLHCLKRLHHSRYPDYYYPNRTEDEIWKEDKHDMHCLEDLVQEVMCKADMSPYTSRWYAKDPRPTGNSNIEHECVNWDMIRAAFKERHVDPWKPGNIVHPIFGPVVTNGKDTVFPDRMSFPTDMEHVGADGTTTYDKDFPGKEDLRGHYEIHPID